MEILKEVGRVAVLSIVSLAVMFATTRLGGKRQIAQMSLFDYVNSITVGSIAAEMATNLESWYRPFTALLVYGAAAWLAHYGACKSLWVRLVLGGRTIVLMKDGVIRKRALGRAGIDLNEFLAQARVAGYFDLNDVESAMLETNGQISFLPRAPRRPAAAADLGLTPPDTGLWYDLVIDGRVMENNLRESGRDETWLRRQLHGAGIGHPREAFYAACDGAGDFFACRGE
ncbi:MAG TPA: DUF421 domain-containing protein [Candidatus Gemmiger stercoravium]|nr:DUF421 domain-containing protein [Candidatus Gemmiger stercoravium]